MRNPNFIKVIRHGLDQLPTDGLQRLVDYINAGKALLLNGCIGERLTHSY